MLKNIIYLFVAIAMFVAIVPANAQKKQEKSNVDPEFQKFWKEFLVSSESGDKDWFETNSVFPLIGIGLCGDVMMLLDKSRFFENFMPREKTEINLYKKIKLKEMNSHEKSEETFWGIDEEGSDSFENQTERDLASHIPNGSLIIELYSTDYGCTETIRFVKINQRYYYFGYGSCCPEAD
jgi:hypothetical protein